MKILIFENSNQMGERLVKQIFETMTDVTFYKAGSYGEALYFLKECNPDIVLLNLKYPRHRGVELLKIIKASNDKTVVIALLNEFDEVSQWKTHGADFIFDKHALQTLL